MSVITIGEIEKGIAKILDPNRKANYETWLNNLIVRFDQRILPISVRVARRWGELYGTLQLTGVNLPNRDSLIAATALTHDLTIITRNEADFAPTGVKVINVWN